MSGAVQDLLTIRFRLNDGSDIGPINFPVATTVATLKESIMSQWPKGKAISPRTVKDVKLISGGKVLDNNITIGEYRSPFYDFPDEILTMHVVVQAAPSEKEKKGFELRKSKGCACVIL